MGCYFGTSCLDSSVPVVLVVVICRQTHPPPFFIVPFLPVHSLSPPPTHTPTNYRHSDAEWNMWPRACRFNTSTLLCLKQHGCGRHQNSLLHPQPSSVPVENASRRCRCYQRQTNENNQAELQEFRLFAGNKALKDRWWSHTWKMTSRIK